MTKLFSRIFILFFGLFLFILILAVLELCSVDESEANVTLTTNNNNLKIVNSIIQTSTKSITKKQDSIKINYPFSYLTNPEYQICEPTKIEKLLLLAFVPSSVDNFNVRRVLRNTWANPIFYDNQKFRVVFMVGLSSNQTVNEMIKKEMKTHGDIVQENFIDSYKNLTLKTLMGLRWSSTYCSNAKFILKIDDDVIMNTKYLLKFLQEKKLKKTFLCNYFNESSVIRDKSSKWFMPYEDYESERYHQYCEGSFTIRIN